MGDKTRRHYAWAANLTLLALLLGAFTTSAHVAARGFDYVNEGLQVSRHQAVLDGQAGNPWQYRVLAPYLVEGVLRLLRCLHLPYPVATAFIGFRVAQDTLILLLAYAYYRKLGLALPPALIGMALLAWGMSYSHYDSDLQFNTFFDISFYLLAGLCLLQGKDVWIIPITVLAALNRETSGLIPFLLIAVAKFARPTGTVRQVMPIFVTSLAAYGAIFIGLRLAFGSQPVLLPYGHLPGIDLLQYNALRAITWQQLIATLSLIPLVALLGYELWPRPLRVFFWTVVPLWFFIHALGAVMAETRLLLVPQALVFIPGALVWLARPATIDADPFQPVSAT